MQRAKIAGGLTLGGLVAALTLFPIQAQSPTEAIAGGEFARQDPTKIVASTACGECHISEFEVWKRTPHSTSFKTLHRKESAEAIAAKMGFRLIKRESLCLRCHYTAVVERNQLRAGSGVSCESCHGAARDWIDVHNNYGSGADYESETAEHREKRIADSRQAGMRRPSDLYDTVASCYGCHTVPEEELVNKGGHSTGSATFELVAWQEKIRHNFLNSFLTGDGSENAERSRDHLRRAYVVGRALDLEFSLRGMAKATGKGIYTKAMSRRVRTSLSELRAIGAETSLPEIDEMIAAVRAVEVVPGNEAALLGTAKLIETATRRFLEQRDGSQLAVLEPLMRGEGGAVEEDLEEDDGESPLDEAAGESQIATTTDQPGSPAVTAGGATPGGSAAAPQRPQVVGERKRRIRPASNRATIGPGSCSGCHGPQNGWWFEDPHFAAADPFFDQRPKNVQIARLYGISASKMARGNQICMDCHGSVVTGRESREVQDGVGCESCHGPAKDWLEPHQEEEGDESLGARRPGYVKALQLGKVDLPNLDVRAKVCSGCHYITDSRLISSGHPSGKNFDYAQGMAQVRHWEKPLASPSSLQAAFSSALSVRGAVPDVPIASLASIPQGSAPGSGSAGQVGGAASAYLDESAANTYRRRSPRPRRAAGSGGNRRASEAPREPLDLNLPPFPEMEETTPVEEVLRQLKERLEAIYQALSPSAEGDP